MGMGGEEGSERVEEVGEEEEEWEGGGEGGGERPGRVVGEGRVREGGVTGAFEGWGRVRGVGSERSLAPYRNGERGASVARECGVSVRRGGRRDAAWGGFRRVRGWGKDGRG